MKLRTLTIWTTGIVLILPLVWFTILSFFDPPESQAKFTVAETILLGLVLWLGNAAGVPAKCEI
jgi:hypothetical protein